MEYLATINHGDAVEKKYISLLKGNKKIKHIHATSG